ncbi:LADA_0D05336g1_1 [Lachancea dasiensis]|uniref:LADA_0D05336g1_1 n=1 Tax=Lachancea dasiensis TaxID=1072105 RepID=A0A1G4J607_9SACH|nr:LADA_0D05336g1_1 [Lachancea dasiensis]
MHSPLASSTGSFKRSRDVSDPSFALSPPLKKLTSDLWPGSEVSDKSTSITNAFSLDKITPAATPTKWTPQEWSSEKDYNSNCVSKSPSLDIPFSDLRLCPSVSSSNLPASLHSKSTTNGPHMIFRIPEIVEQILRCLESTTSVPRETPRPRRKPQSFSHALLMCHGDEKVAKKAWQEAARINFSNGESVGPSLYNCLLVNQLWHKVALSIITENLHFTDSRKMRKLVASPSNVKERFSKASTFVLHKLNKLTQTELEAIAPVVASERLRWVELYICPKLSPPPFIFHHSKNIEKLILPGNQRVDDKFLMNIAPYLSKLKILDLRACEKVTDGGILSISTSCPALEMCNLGRHRNGKAITSVSLVALARNTNVDTIGAAGCHVTDAGIWELAMQRGSHIKRLSLNDCNLLTNNSLPTLIALKYFPQLSVLEIRNVKHITNLRSIVAFIREKRSQGIPVLIEGGEQTELLMREAEHRMQQEYSTSVLASFSRWINEDDED